LPGTEFLGELPDGVSTSDRDKHGHLA